MIECVKCGEWFHGKCVGRHEVKGTSKYLRHNVIKYFAILLSFFSVITCVSIFFVTGFNWKDHEWHCSECVKAMREHVQSISMECATLQKENLRLAKKMQNVQVEHKDLLVNVINHLEECQVDF